MRGLRSRLAEHLGVTRQRVTQWLNEDREPGGETTLSLLEWVKAEEAKQKRPGDASNTARTETRPAKKSHSNENRRSGPKSTP